MLFTALGVSVMFLMALSLPFDFGRCPNPSREEPFFTSGRLIIGVLVPFLILLVRGIEFLLSRWAPNVGPAVMVAAIVLMSLVSQLVLISAVFPSEFNWFHLR